MIKNIALSGCGVRGMAEAGALSVFDKYGYSTGIKNVGGTSAGAINACLFAMGFPAAKTKDIISNTDFKSFEDGTLLDIGQEYTRYGLHPGNVFASWLKELINLGCGNPDATFLDFKNKGFKNLVVFAANVSKRCIERFDAELTPSTRVWEAIRCSMSIPWFFEAYKLNGCIYNDGGISYNYPIDFMDQYGQANTETVGLHFNYVGQPTNAEMLDFGTPRKMLAAQWDMLLSAQDIMLGKQSENLSRTIIIDSLGISATNFGVTDQQKEAMYQAGIAAATNYFR